MLLVNFIVEDIMKDQLLKALVLNEHVRLYIVRTTDLVQEAQDRF